MITHSFTSGGKEVQLSFPNSDDYIARQVAKTGNFYEAELLHMAGRLIVPGDVIVDIGANVGNHTVYFALLCGCTVYAYEPNPEALLYLRVNVQQNGIAGAVHVMPYAVGERAGTARMLSSNASNLGAFTLEAAGDSGEFRQVSMDDCQFPRRVKLLKIDVEGMEGEVLRGALNLIERDQPFIVCEASDQSYFEIVNSLLATRGYWPLAVYGSTATYVFVPQEYLQGIDPRLLPSIQETVVTKAKANAVHVAHRQTRETVIKHTEMLAKIQARFDDLVTDQESKFDGLLRQHSENSTKLETAIDMERSHSAKEISAVAHSLQVMEQHLAEARTLAEQQGQQLTDEMEAALSKLREQEAHLSEKVGRLEASFHEQIGQHLASVVQLEHSFHEEQAAQAKEVVKISHDVKEAISQFGQLHTRIESLEKKLIRETGGALARQEENEARLVERFNGLHALLQEHLRQQSAVAVQLEAAIEGAHGTWSEDSAALRKSMEGLARGIELVNARLEAGEHKWTASMDAMASRIQERDALIDVKLGNLEAALNDQVIARQEFAQNLEKATRREQETRMKELAKINQQASAATRELQGVRSQLEVELQKSARDLEELRKVVDKKNSELTERIETVNGRHDALLNGRIFKTLSRLKGAVNFKKRDIDAPLMLAPPADTVLAPAQPPLNSVVASFPADFGPVNIERRRRMERRSSGLRAADAVIEDFPMVSVIMTTFNAVEHVGEAIDSILKQTYENLELIVVDDASSDKTLAIAWGRAKRDKRVRIIESKINRGTYWSKNLGVVQARGELVTFMDSDDISEPERIRKQVELAVQKGGVGSTCNYIRRDEAGNTVLNRGLEQRIALISLMVKRQVFFEVGYFDSIRTSADDEFMERLKLVYGRRALSNVGEPLYIARYRENSLSTEQGNGNNLAAADAAGFLSSARHHFVQSYKLWYEQLREQNCTPYVPFPSTNRPFQVYGKLRIDGERFSTDPVAVFMASFPAREEKLKRAVQSLLPQVDRLYIYLNDYTEVPNFLFDERIVVEVGGRDLRDNGKIYHMANAPAGYFFTVDDDIEYPDDYCEQLLRAIERYDRKAVVGVHGVVLENPLTRYFSSNRVVYSFKHALKQDIRVNLLGTGTVAFHSSLLRPDLKDFPSTGMADVWMGILCKQANIPMMTVQRRAAWLTPIVLPGESDPSLFDEFKENDSAQTVALQAAGNWRLDLT